MAARSANVMARVEPIVKEQAELVMEQLGLTASTAINLFYRQIIQDQALPFTPSVKRHHPKALDEMTKEEFDQRMAIGYAQAKNGDGRPVNDVFNDLIREIDNV